MALMDSLNIAAAGMRVQSTRLKVVAENIANADATSSTPGGDPYRRKTVFFKNAMDKQLGIQTVAVSGYGTDPSPFIKRYDPSHPAADAQGYVQYPNVNTMIEMVDMREARRAYEANINVVSVSKAMLSQTLQLLTK